MTKFTPELLAEIFKYHPPTTEERKQKHEACNKATMDFALACIEPGGSALAAAAECLKAFEPLVRPGLSLNRADSFLQSAAMYASVPNPNYECMVQDCQFARMLINQAITYESLGIEL